MPYSMETITQKVWRFNSSCHNIILTALYQPSPAMTTEGKVVAFVVPKETISIPGVSSENERERHGNFPSRHTPTPSNPGEAHWFPERRKQRGM
jgi:hypothetical protein